MYVCPTTFDSRLSETSFEGSMRSTWLWQVGETACYIQSTSLGLFYPPRRIELAVVLYETELLLEWFVLIIPGSTEGSVWVRH